MHGWKVEPRSLCGLYAILMRVRIVMEKMPAVAKSEKRACKTVWAIVTLMTVTIVPVYPVTLPGLTCQRVELQGEVGAGQEWKTPFGEGWIFRVLPIAPSSAGYTGWDLAVDRESPAGYPDALLLATLPYNSINEREIGTTFGLRAQDALGWNPRSFRFLNDPRNFREAHWLYLRLFHSPKDATAEGEKASMARLLELERQSSIGQFRILDARLVPGTADPKPFAQEWAIAFSRNQHQTEPVPPAQASPEGKLSWMRFAVTLWLPSGWKFPSGTKPVRAACPK